MEWQVIEIKNEGGNSVPFVSIGRGQLDFSAEACALVNDTGEYKFAQLLKASENGKLVIAVKFLVEHESNSIAITRKSQSGKTIKGMTIRNKGAIQSLYGQEGINNGVKRHKVELVDKNILKILD